MKLEKRVSKPSFFISSEEEKHDETFGVHWRVID